MEFISDLMWFGVIVCVVVILNIVSALKLGLGETLKRWTRPIVHLVENETKLAGTWIVLQLSGRTTKTRMGRKTSIVRLPNWEWLTVIGKDPSGRWVSYCLLDSLRAAGGAFATTVKKHDLVFLLKGIYSPETERFVIEHELGHISHGHMARLTEAGHGVGIVQRFELEADAYAASVVGWAGAYYALTEIQTRLFEEHGHAAQGVVATLSTRKAAIKEKWLTSSNPI